MGRPDKTVGERMFWVVMVVLLLVALAVSDLDLGPVGWLLRAGGG